MTVYRNRSNQRDYRENRKAESGFLQFIMASRYRKALVAVCILLLIGVGTKVASDYLIYRQVELVDAFAASDAGNVESRLQITADYGSAFLTERDKQSLIAYLANAIGVNMDGEVEYKENDICQVYEYRRAAKQAETTIKAVTLREEITKTYLYVELVIYQDTEYNALEYRDIILDAMDALKVKQVETTLQLAGIYEGKLAFGEWNRIADNMVKKLSGKIIYENRDEELYTIYAYSKLLPEYIVVEGKKMNMQVVIRYEEDYDRTVVYLATPLLRGEW